jgi:uncharacterized protein (UPF0548 family)
LTAVPEDVPIIRYSVRIANVSPAEFSSLVDALLAYRVYPPDLLRAAICPSDTTVRIGGLIVQRVRFGIFVLETAVRVDEVRNEVDLCSYSYRTVVGHPERGIASFQLNRVGADATFEINTRSVPGSTLARISGPFAARAQRHLNTEAVRTFASRALCGDLAGRVTSIA